MEPTFVKVGAIMVRLDASAWVGDVNVEGVEVPAYLFDWSEILNETWSTRYYPVCDYPLTWVRDAPVSRRMLFVESGSPGAPLV